MEIQKGSCSISVDGDLFKLKLTIPLAVDDKNRT
jgi:hypothetical protein